MHKIIDNLEGIKNKLKQLKLENYQNLKIIAVSKTFSLNSILPLIEYGHDHFGENKVQEALEKWPKIKESYPNLKLHMVGKIQSNKVKFLLPVLIICIL